MDIDKDEINILLAGYFHDIGKAIQKVSGRGGIRDSGRGKHQEISERKFIEVFSKSPIFNHVNPVVSDLIAYHHVCRKEEDEDIIKNKPDNVRRLLKFLILADHLDSTTRIEVPKEYFSPTSGSQISGSLTTVLIPLWILDKDVIGLSNKPREFFTKINNNYRAEKINTKIDIMFESLKGVANKVNISEWKYFIEAVDQILMEYTLYLNASEYTPREKYSPLGNISLYYHLKNVSIIAHALYVRYKNDDKFKKLVDSRDVCPFVNNIKKSHKDYRDILNTILKSLYIDVSGIQKFITNIHTTHKNALKIMRGRSIFLELLQKYIARYICERLNIPYTNIIRDNGGFIHILIPTFVVKNVDDEIEHIIKEINYFLYSIFKGEISIYYQLSDVLFKYDYKDYLDYLSNSTLKDRKPIMIKVDNSNDNRHRTSENLCDYCRVNTTRDQDEEGIKICKTCEYMKDLGKESSRENKKYVGFDFTIQLSELLSSKDKHINLKKIISLDENKKSDKKTYYRYLILKESTEMKEEYPYIPSSLYRPRKSLEDVAKTINNPYISLIKIDIDDLGSIELQLLSNLKEIEDVLLKIFKEELKKEEDLEIPLTLSQKYFLFKHIENSFMKSILDTIYKSNDYRDTVTVVYNGGDDALLLMPLKLSFNFLYDFYNNFYRRLYNRKYLVSSENKVITMSASIYYEKYDFPFYIMYEFANHLLEKFSKSTKKIKGNNWKKNSWTYTYASELYTHKWSDLGYFVERINDNVNHINGNTIEKLREWITNGELSSSEFFKLNEIQQKYFLYLMMKSGNLAEYSLDFIPVPEPYIKYVLRENEKIDERAIEIIKESVRKNLFSTMYDFIRSTEEKMEKQEVIR